MSRPPVWRRLLDLLALFACILGVAGMSLSAVHSDHWPTRLVFAGIAAGLLVLVVRGSRVVWEDWRSLPDSAS